MKLDLFIVGAGGFGREFLTQLLDCNEIASLYNVKGFLDEDLKLSGHKLLGYPIFPLSSFIKINQKTAFAICVVNPLDKRHLYQKLDSPNSTFPNFIFGKSYEEIQGEGIIVCVDSIVNTGVALGDFSILCEKCMVGHNSSIGNFGTLYSFAFIAGHVNCGENYQGGANSVVLQNLNVCNNVFVGAGAVVTKNIEKEGKYVGVPAHIMQN